MNQLTKFAKSPQGRKLVDKAQQIASDPKTKEQVEKAKLKFAEIREGAASKGKAGGESHAARGATQAEPDDTPPAAAPPAARREPPSDASPPRAPSLASCGSAPRHRTHVPQAQRRGATMRRRARWNVRAPNPPPLPAHLPARRRSRERIEDPAADVRGAARPHEPGHKAGRAQRAAVARRALAARHLDLGTVAPGGDQATMPRFEPTNPDAYNWGEYDPLMAAAKARGWSVVMTISGPVPKWATAAKLDDKTRPSPAAFAAFTTAVGRKYGDQVNTWAIWNEPNQPQFLLPQFGDGGKALSPKIYRSLYFAGVRGLRKAGQTNDRFLLGETSPRGTGRVVAPLAFLRGTLCLNAKYKRVGTCARLTADGYAHHAYTTRQGPFFKPPSPDDVTIGVLVRLTKALARAKAAGALTKALPIYLTEFGIQSTPDTIQGVSLSKQVEYRAIAERIAYENPRVVAFSQYLLRDSDPTGPKEYGGFESGLRFADGRPKPSLPAFRLPIAVRRVGSKASVWGLVRRRPASRPRPSRTRTRARRSSCR